MSPRDASLKEILPQILERVRRNRELRKALVAAERDLVRVEGLAAIGEITVTLHHGGEFYGTADPAGGGGAAP